MTKILRTIRRVVLVPIVCSCGTGSQPDLPPVRGTESRKAVQEWEENALADLEETVSPAGIDIPLVICSNPGNGFFGTSWRTGPQGQYEAYESIDRRAEGGHKVRITVRGSPQPAPFLPDAPSSYEPSPGGSELTPRQWKSVHATALGKDIRYYVLAYAMGDTDDTWQTEIFSMEGKAGKIGSYQATVESTSAGLVPTLFAKLGVR